MLEKIKKNSEEVLEILHVAGGGKKREKSRIGNRRKEWEKNKLILIINLLRVKKKKKKHCQAACLSSHQNLTLLLGYFIMVKGQK